MWPNPQENADLLTFTEEILNGKLHFLCSEFFSTDWKVTYYATLVSVRNIDGIVVKTISHMFSQKKIMATIGFDKFIIIAPTFVSLFTQEAAQRCT